MNKIQLLRGLLIKYYKSLTVILLIIITALSLLPIPEFQELPGKDKTLHLIAYAALAFPVSFARPNYWLRIILIFLLWSAAIELLQPYFDRNQNWKDLVANSVGLFLGYVTGRLIDSLTRSKK